jgi:trehalose-6-phosphatase
MFGPVLAQVSVASSHGFVISSRFGKKEVGAELLPALAVAHAALRAWQASAPAGVALEDNASTLSVHYRKQVTLRAPRPTSCYAPTPQPYHPNQGSLHSPTAERRKLVEDAVDEVVAASEGALEKRGGKEVWELRPRAPWDKGRALAWLLGKMALANGSVAPFVIAAGDDVTDEDSFVFLRQAGAASSASILVAAPLHEEFSRAPAGVVGSVRATAATHYVRNPEELASLLKALHAALCVAPRREE